MEEKKVYLLFMVFGEGDGYSVFDLKKVFSHSNLNKALNYTKSTMNTEFKRNFDLDITHTDMNEENGFTFIGKRTEVDQNCSYSKFGGFVIEEQEVL